jgi:adenosylcobinamide-GDP ribazoletransferase
MGAGSREKRLEILKDPRVGSFGLFAGIAYLGALWHCATVVAGATVVASVTLVAGATAASGAITVASATTVAILPLSALPLFLAAPVAGRAAAVLVPVFLAPARPGGLGAMIQPYSKRAAFSGIVFSLLLCFAISALAALFSKDAAAAAGSALSALFESWFRSPVGARVAFRVAATALSFAAGIAAGLLPTLATYGRKLGGYTGDALGAAVCLGTLGHMACALAIFGVL